MMFEPISIKEYVDLYVKNNRSENKSEVEARIIDTLKAALSGVKCNCGNPIWVIGAAEAGLSCFTCITGESTPDEDYEIDQHLNYLKKLK